METTQHQEWRSRQHINIPAVLKAGFGTGLLFFLMSGGSPWSTAGTMNAVMGRDIPMAFPMLVICHFGLALLYMFVIAAVIYRYKTVLAVPAGVGLALVLYGANYLLFSAFGVNMQSPEFRPFMVHFMFGLFGSLLYKAMSVPKPLPT
jgi:hypothetical protein